LSAPREHGILPAMAEPVRLYDYFRSSAAYRVRIGLHLKGVAYESVAVDLLHNGQAEAGYRALNPQGLVPALEMDGRIFTQSLAILDYLDARFPDPPFVPREPAARAQVLAMALAIACDIHPIDNLRVLRYLKNEMGQPQEAIDAWYVHWVRQGLEALETMAADWDHPYLSGETPGIADICLVPQLYNAHRFGVDIAPWPTLERLERMLTALPAFAASHPDKWVPAEA